MLEYILDERPELCVQGFDQSMNLIYSIFLSTISPLTSSNPICSDSDTLSFSATSLGRVILNDDPLDEVLVTTISLSGIEKVIGGIS